MKATLDHIGIAVSNLNEALAFYRDALGLEIEPAEEVPSQRVRVHFALLGDEEVPAKRDPGPGAPGVRHGGMGAPGVRLELLEATSDDSPIAKYLAKRGPGVHHITLRVDDIVGALARLKSRGVRLVDEAPRSGAHGSLVAFIHPSSAHGVLVELTQAI
jgi:methylmalonyl-CoA/ethylmalonyl-CoA epimerase